MLKGCFESGDWEMFQEAAEGDINHYAISVVGYINQCTDIIPKTSACKFPNQKSWVNGDIRTNLRECTAAYNSGDPMTYKKYKVSNKSHWEASELLAD